MKYILEQIKKIINDNIKEYLPEVKPTDLDGNGTIYYMNDQNGTEWDYYVNKHLSPFMVFYNEKENLGIAKLLLFQDGAVTLYLYNNKGKDLLKTINTKIDVKENDILKFATLLKNKIDYNEWNASIDKIDVSKEPTEEEINNFIEAGKDLEKPKAINEMMQKFACVSRKILDEGYKVGYMNRDEPLNDTDSGWSILAGNEDDDYIGNSKNTAVLTINQVYQLDSDIFDYIDSPVGSSFIRISSTEFEEDNKDKEIFIEKR